MGIKMRNKKKVAIIMHKESTESAFSPQLSVISGEHKKIKNSDKAIKNYLATLGVGRARARC